MSALHLKQTSFYHKWGLHHSSKSLTTRRTPRHIPDTSVKTPSFEEAQSLSFDVEILMASQQKRSVCHEADSRQEIACRQRT